jgi:nucleoid-associated protein YgaU
MMVLVLAFTLLVGLGAIVLAVAWVLTPTPTPSPVSAKNPPLVFPSPTPINTTKIQGEVVPTPTIAQPIPPQPPVSAPEATKTPRKHIVQRGENLFRISLRYGVPMEAIVKANNIQNPALIYAGQVLIIPDTP